MKRWIFPYRKARKQKDHGADIFAVNYAARCGGFSLRQSRYFVYCHLPLLKDRDEVTLEFVFIEMICIPFQRAGEDIAYPILRQDCQSFLPTLGFIQAANILLTGALRFIAATPLTFVHRPPQDGR